MYRGEDLRCGLPPRIYRTPEEIRHDIFLINEKIEEANSMLNIRSLLIDLLVGENSDNPKKLIPDLEDAIREARRALESLGELNEELLLLEEEIGEAEWLV